MMSHNLLSFSKIITQKEIAQNEKERIKSKCFQIKNRSKNSFIGNMTQYQKSLKSSNNKKRVRYQQNNNLPQLSTKDSYNVKSISNSFDESSLSIPTRKNNSIIKIEHKNDVLNYVNLSKEIPSRNKEINEIKIICNTVKGSSNESETSSIERHIKSKVNTGLLNQMNNYSESSLNCLEINESNNQMHSNNSIIEQCYLPLNNNNEEQNKIGKKFLCYSKSNKYEMSYKYINDELIDSFVDKSKKIHNNLSDYNFISSLNSKSKELPAIKKKFIIIIIRVFCLLFIFFLF